jgi:hypothetical protein
MKCGVAKMPNNVFMRSCKRRGLSEDELSGFVFTPTLADLSTVSVKTIQCVWPSDFTTYSDLVIRVDPCPTTTLWPRWVHPTIESMLAAFESEPNWDSYGARPVDKKSIEIAVSLLLTILRENSPEPAVVPTSIGGVQLEWHKGGIDLEIEVTPTGTRQAYFHDHRSGLGWEGEVSEVEERLRDAVLTLSR